MGVGVQMSDVHGRARRRAALVVVAFLATAVAVLPGMRPAGAATVPVQEQRTLLMQELGSSTLFWSMYGQRTQTPYNVFDWTTDGCSWSPDKPLGFDFSGPCRRHDFNYRNSKRLLIFTTSFRDAADNDLLNDMKAVCATENVFVRPACDGAAYTYYYAVREAGGSGIQTITAPDAPTGVAAVAGNAQATVSWHTPSSDHGSAITGYTVAGSPGGSCSTTGALSCTVPGLTNGKPYSFTVVARNAVGTSAASSPSSAVTPTAPTTTTMTTTEAPTTTTTEAPTTTSTTEAPTTTTTEAPTTTSTTEAPTTTTSTTEAPATTSTTEAPATTTTTEAPTTTTTTQPAPALSPTERFAAAADADFLGAVPPAGTLEQQAAQIDASSATSRYGFALGLAQSDQWLTRVLTRFYQDTLQRDPDPPGLAFWEDQLRSGQQTVAQVAAAFYSSTEYFTKLSRSDLGTWVDNLYLALLVRSSDPQGRAYWVGAAQTSGRGSVAYTFFQSAESRNTRVKALYEQLLGRPPDRQGLQAWSARILTDGDLSLAANLAASDEYFTRAQTRPDL